MLIDSNHAIAHNKVIVIDGSVVLTSPFTFTKAAEESNAESLLAFHHAAMAQRYVDN